ncbi:MAG: hypothetical protein RLZZ502_761 [Pseudomonadota bacterium]|jgi:phosphoribosylformylglycinamidine cyclo-ligase
MPQDNSAEKLSYRAAGVDIEAGDALVERIKPFAKKTMRPEVMAGIGGFGALMSLPTRYKNPVLVSGTDGVGTKLKLAFATGKHDTIGIDLVAMSVNDILVQGAEPLFFLDYYVCERLEVDVAADVIKGIAQGCEQAGCALIGGETAEHPNAFIPHEYDLAGFAVGVVERDQALDGRKLAPGDVLLGLASSGPHSNGYSLIRKIIERSGADLLKPLPAVDASKSLGEALLTPTRIYVKNILALREKMPIHAMAHITGGGITENTHRMFPEHLVAQIHAASLPKTAVFEWLKQVGGLVQEEMWKTFNCGIGFILAVPGEYAEQAKTFLSQAGESVFDIGVVRTRHGDEPQTQIK